jgi:hypothetical protein
MGHLHTKTMNRLQEALLEHDFVIQYNKGEMTLVKSKKVSTLSNQTSLTFKKKINNYRT